MAIISFIENGNQPRSRLRLAPEFCVAAQRQLLFDAFFQTTRLVYPILRVLRLSDQKVAAMDKLYFYVRQADANLTKWVDQVDKTLTKLATADFIKLVGGKDLMKKYELSSLSDSESDADDDSSSDEEEDSDGEGEEIEVDKDLEDSDDEEEPHDDDEETFPEAIVRLWKKRRPKLAHDYSRAGWLLAPNSIIHADAKANRSAEDNTAMERVLFKFFVNSSLTGDKLERKKAEVSRTFWTEYNTFSDRTGPVYSQRHIWISATAEDNVSLCFFIP